MLSAQASSFRSMEKAQFKKMKEVNAIIMDDSFLLFNLNRNNEMNNILILHINAVKLNLKHQSIL